MSITTTNVDTTQDGITRAMQCLDQLEDAAKSLKKGWGAVFTEVQWSWKH